MDKVACSNENIEETHLIMLKPSKRSDKCFKQACMMRDPLELLDSSCEEIIKDEPTIKEEVKKVKLEIDSLTLDFDSSIEIIKEYEEEDTIEIHEDMDEIKKEYMEKSSPLKRVNSLNHNITAKRFLMDLTNLEKSSDNLNNNTSILVKQKCPLLDDFQAPEHKENSSGEKPKVSHMSSPHEKDLGVDFKCVSQAGDRSFEYGEIEAPEEKENSSEERQKDSPTSLSHEKDLGNNLKSVSQAVDGSFDYGDLILAKFGRSPAWPSIIVREPESQHFKREKEKWKKGGTSLVAQFYVLFLNYKYSVAWIDESAISTYKSPSSSKIGKKLLKAIVIAETLVEMSGKERLRKAAEQQEKEMDAKYLKKKLYNKKYPKLFKEPYVRVQTIEMEGIKYFTT